MENSKITWTDNTWNPWTGCSRVNTGCLHCYAEAMSERFGSFGQWGPGGTRKKTSDAYWRKPVTWNKVAVDAGMRLRVFPSLCDPFEDWDDIIHDHRGKALGVCRGCGKIEPRRAYCTHCDCCNVDLTMDDLRRDMFRLIDETPNLDWLLLTKRPEDIMRMWGQTAISCMASLISGRRPEEGRQRRKNVWLIYSASDQETLEAGLPHLLECRRLSPVLGLSLEPLVGPVDLGSCVMDLDFVIVGGESGPDARPCEVEWIRSVVEQCVDAETPCFVKQDSGSKPGQQGQIDDDLWKFKQFPRF